jgi:hypothetical protein
MVCPHEAAPGKAELCEARRPVKAKLGRDRLRVVARKRERLTFVASADSRRRGCVFDKGQSLVERRSSFIAAPFGEGQRNLERPAETIAGGVGALDIFEHPAETRRSPARRLQVSASLAN